MKKVKVTKSFRKCISSCSDSVWNKIKDHKFTVIYEDLSDDSVLVHVPKRFNFGWTGAHIFSPQKYHSRDKYWLYKGEYKFVKL